MDGGVICATVVAMKLVTHAFIILTPIFKFAASQTIPTIHIQPASMAHRRSQFKSVSDEKMAGHKITEQRQRAFESKIEQRRSTVESMVSSSSLGEPPLKQRIIECRSLGHVEGNI